MFPLATEGEVGGSRKMENIGCLVIFYFLLNVSIDTEKTLRNISSVDLVRGEKCLGGDAVGTSR